MQQNNNNIESYEPQHNYKRGLMNLDSLDKRLDRLESLLN